MNEFLKKVLSNKEISNKIVLLIGTRPGIIMFSPLIRACLDVELEFIIIHTGQHYSPNMDSLIFDQLKLPRPNYRIENTHLCKTHGSQTATMLEGIEKILLKERPFIILVGGDANTNLAGALAARKLHINVGHVEAGERSNDWSMPEEHNRRIIDHISDYLFTTNDKGRINLEKECVQGEIFVTGNTIVDAAQQNARLAIKSSKILKKWAAHPNEYAILTTHREENVDDPERLRNILQGIETLIKAVDLKVFFLVHPRTLLRLRQYKLEKYSQGIKKLEIHESPPYLDFIAMLNNSKLVLTDSGGVQQEACILRKPCITLRENTEWTETLELGANILAGTSPKRICEAAETMLTKVPNWETPFGNGQAANRIIDICKQVLNER